MNQSPRAWFDKFSTVVAHHELRWSSSDYFIFVRHSFVDTIVLTVYVKDIVITGSLRYYSVESLLSFHFHMKDFGLLRYFLETEVARSLKGLFLSQKKYLTDLLEETGTWDLNF